MYKYRIDLYDPSGSLVKRFICGHIDGCRSKTILAESETDKFKGEFYILERLTHFNVFCGLITLYYDSGAFLEITRFRA